MTKTLSLLLSLASSTQAALARAVPVTAAPVSGAWSGPPLGAASFAASITAPIASSLPVCVLAPAVRAPWATGLPNIESLMPQEADGHSEEALTLKGREFFDGKVGKAAASAVAVPVSATVGGRPSRLDPGWSLGSFASAVDGLPIFYKRRDVKNSKSPRIYAGGLALQESFDPLFSVQAEPARTQIFLWMRGHSPTQWNPTRSPLDADARDLARAILLAAKDSLTGSVELALHSFAAIVFQRMVQLRRDPEVREALGRLEGSRIVLLHATTHFDDSEKQAGPDFERMSEATRKFIDWLDLMDAAADNWRLLARINPFLGPQIAMWLSQWRLQREQVLAMASKEAAGMMRKDLETPWPQAIDSIRRGFMKDLNDDARNAGWQEAMLRRSSDMFRLEFTKNDVRVIRRLGMRLDLVHATQDQLLNWGSARVLFGLLGIPTPEAAPAPGGVLSSRDGLFRARIVSGDHYFPLKRPEQLGPLLEP